MSDSSDDDQPFNLRDYDDDDTDDDRPNKRRKTMKTLRSRGLGFVKSTGQEEDQEDEEDEEDEDVDDERPSMGLGLGSGMGGFRKSFNIGEYNEELEDTAPAPDMSPQRQAEKTAGTGPSAFGSGGRIQKNSFAARMMAKQGYVEGQGLGRAGQGITAPIQAKILQSRAGLGQGSGTPEPPRRKPESGRDKKPSSKGSTPGASTPRIRAPPKAKYAVTAIESRGLHIPEAMKQIIVDATGSETKTLTSLSGFSTPTRATSPDPGLEAAKATARIKLQLQAFADAWDATKEQETHLEHEDTQLGAALALHDEEIQRFNDIITAFERVTVDDSNEARDWESCIARLQGIQIQFAGYISDLSLPELAASCLETPFRREMADWEPLSHPALLVESLQSISQLLELEKSITSRHRKRTTHFESLLLLHWYPRIRSAMGRDWDVYDPDPAYKLITAWSPILPAWLIYKTIHETIVPKLIEAVKRFPKPIETGTSTGRYAGAGGRKSKRSAPALHTWLFDWWTLLSSDDLDLERFAELKSLVKTKVDSDSWPMWKPLLGSRRAKPLLPPTRDVPPAGAPIAPAADLEEITFKTLVEDWASENNLLLHSSHKSDAFGRLLYRLQDAEGRSRGLLVYLQDDVVFSEDGEPFALDERLLSRAVGRS
ncbi:hypothetical protein A1O3_10106 [Capronia epimyces CBS 606.96]|uniref:G-patch domain-containing protein n=1 Tax=Capronia epimyces CBS 606.96 TaxID=1182542 RepID=W9Y3C6_9EURO|nr:uncharacterized protein A1O3_10106 [Capronia epimyces CBS 606.96]EXJ76949.1 hypothetical protein A1O3_10106 [Capronia epimyces CBS 606.96]